MLLRLKIKWLQSHYRTKILVFRYFLIGRFLGQKPKAEVYLSLNDPHSFMLVQMLSRLETNYNLNFKVLFIWGTLPGITICPKLYRQWAIKDANLTAEQFNLVHIKDEPTSASLTTGQQAWQLQVNNIANAEQIFINTWGNQFEEHFQTSTPTINHQVKNQLRLKANGHYAPASIFFAGAWYVGVERLYHFENMLKKLSLINELSAALGIKYQLSHSVEPQSSSHKTIEVNANKAACESTVPIVIYLSLRSPYSYLGLVQAISLAERSHTELVIKPILPLLMRGATIPLVKQKYIYLDAFREAKKLGIEFTGFTDPLGAGVINAYRLFAWAEQQGKAVEYMLACFKAIYVNGIDLANLASFDLIFKELSLNIEDAYAYQDQHDWQQWADMNQVELTNLDLWGVPSFSYGKNSYWGQDRILAIEKEITFKRMG